MSARSDYRFLAALAIDSTPEADLCLVRRIETVMPEDRRQLRLALDEIDSLRAEVARWRTDTERMAVSLDHRNDEIERLQAAAADHSNCTCDYCSLRPVGDS